MIRLIALVIVILIAVALARTAANAIRGVAARRAAQRPRRPGRYGWERRREQLGRRARSRAAPEENRGGIIAFIESRRGVEAFVEPRTMMDPLSVVLVAEDGEWRRFSLRDDAILRELAKGKALQVFDASQTGYPDRMRRYRRDQGRKDDSGAGG